MYDEVGKTQFGQPTKVISIGSTFWTVNELHKHICYHLKPIYHRGTYDVITNNCNHFSGQLLSFLNGRRLPENVSRQPELLLRSTFISEIMGPILNIYFRDAIVAREKGK